MKIKEIRNLIINKAGLYDTPHTHAFLGGLFWSTFGIMGSSFIMFIAAVLSGRFMGPTEYGKYALIVAIAAILSVIFYGGFNSVVVKYASPEEDKERKGRFYTYGLVGIFCTSLLFGALVYVFRVPVASIFNTEPYILTFAILLSILGVYKAFFDACFVSDKKFQKLAYIKIIESISVITSFLLFTGYFGRTFQVYYWPLVIGAFVAIISYLAILRNKFSGFRGIKLPKGLINYQLIAIGLIAVTYFVNNIDKVFINHYLPLNFLGIYNAYLVASVLVFTQVSLAIYNALFPSMTRVKNKEDVLKTLDKFFIKYSVGIILFVAVVTTAIMYLFGKNYGLNLLYISLISVYSYLLMWVTCYTSVVVSSRRLMNINARFVFLKPIFIIALYYTLVVFDKKLIPYVMLVLILSGIYDLVFVKQSIKIFNRQELKKSEEPVD